jgi:hypothetical protein
LGFTQCLSEETEPATVIFPQSARQIVDAVFHATGKRIRDLPTTLDKLLR